MNANNTETSSKKLLNYEKIQDVWEIQLQTTKSLYKTINKVNKTLYKICKDVKEKMKDIEEDMAIIDEIMEKMRENPQSDQPDGQS